MHVEQRTNVCPHVWRMLSTPISAPRWRGSAATSRSVAALVERAASVQAGAIPIAERQERMRQREDDVHIRDVEQVALAGMEPALARLRLALRAVPVAARIIRDGLMAARDDRSDVPPRAAVRQRDRVEHLQLWHVRRTDALDEACRPLRG